MHQAKVFDEADIIVRSHLDGATTRPAPGFGTCCMNIDGVKYTFTAAPAHQTGRLERPQRARGCAFICSKNIDSVRSNIRPEARIQGVITEGGAAPNVVPDRTAADFYIRYPDEVYLEQVRQVGGRCGARGGVSDGDQGEDRQLRQNRDGISVATLAEVAFAYHEKVRRDESEPEPANRKATRRPAACRATFPASDSAPIRPTGRTTPTKWKRMPYRCGSPWILVDAQAMTAILFDFATHPDYRAAVKREFDSLKGLHDEYLDALRKVYVVPKVVSDKPIP